MKEKPAQTEQALQSQWQQLMHTIEAPAPAASQAWNELAQHYTEQHRHYHNLHHIAHLLHLINEHQALLHRPELLQLAAWYHDAIYEPLQPGNEERSAQLAEQRLPELGLPAGEVQQVAALIRATAGHRLTAETDTAGNRFFLDIDLSVPGQPWQDYEQYSRQVRQEYAQVPEELYRQGRAQVLENLLQKKPLYHTPVLRSQWEQQARQNLERELQLLRE